jgi:hypothetical protein
MAEISSVGGGVWIFSGTTQWVDVLPYAQGMQKIVDVDTISCGHARREKSTDVGKM